MRACPDAATVGSLGCPPDTLGDPACSCGGAAEAPPVGARGGQSGGAAVSLHRRGPCIVLTDPDEIATAAANNPPLVCGSGATECDNSGSAGPCHITKVDRIWIEYSSLATISLPGLVSTVRYM